MDILQTVESAAHSAVEAVEHPFLTIGARLKVIAGHLVVFGGHPYAAPPLQDALTELHGVVTDLAQEVAELRVPCPCKPASTSAAAGDAGSGEAAPPAPAAASNAEGFEVVTAADAADFRAWKAAKAAAAAFTGLTVV